MLRARKGQQKVPILKKTTELFPSIEGITLWLTQEDKMLECVGQAVVVVSLGGEAEVAVHNGWLRLGEHHCQARQSGPELAHRNRRRQVEWAHHLPVRAVLDPAEEIKGTVSHWSLWKNLIWARNPPLLLCSVNKLCLCIFVYSPLHNNAKKYENNCDDTRLTYSILSCVRGNSTDI